MTDGNGDFGKGETPWKVRFSASGCSLIVEGNDTVEVFEKLSKSCCPAYANDNDDNADTPQFGS
jgi:hypothetical protein